MALDCAGHVLKASDDSEYGRLTGVIGGTHRCHNFEKPSLNNKVHGSFPCGLR